MTVRCVRLTNPNTSAREETNSWLTIGRIYTVLAVYIDQESGVQFRLVGDDRRTPALHDSRQFEIANATIPRNWIAYAKPAGVFELLPTRWAEPGFWERYFDSEPRAVSVFADERALIEEANERSDRENR